MASTSGKKTSSSTRRKTSSRSKSRSTGRTSDRSRKAQESKLYYEVVLLVLFAAMLLLFLCNFGIIGPVGNFFSRIMFGLFGLTAYAFPVVLFLAISFYVINAGSRGVIRKLIAAIVLFLMVGVLCELIAGIAPDLAKYSVKDLYVNSEFNKTGGGVFAGSLTYLMNKYMGTVGTVLVVVLLLLISAILLTERSFLSGMKKSSEAIRTKSKEMAVRNKEYAQIYREEHEEQRQKREEERALREEERAAEREQAQKEKVLRVDKKASGVSKDLVIVRPEVSKRRSDMHEVTYAEDGAAAAEPVKVSQDVTKIPIRTMHKVNVQPEEVIPAKEPDPVYDADPVRIHRQGETVKVHRNGETTYAGEAAGDTAARRGDMHRVGGMTEPIPDIAGEIEKKEAQEKKAPKKYIFPPTSRLAKGTVATTDPTKELQETAMRLKQTLATFGVNVTITDISQGPSVTRYELQPEQGVKVSKIVGLTDDIKLNLAATDIRIEAPIPGKAAIGIEVPNKENMTVALRDLLESKEFKEFPSNIAFAVGKDIAGSTIVTDIGKMPHMLIAGATGSGKSVCINTLIMSILYKAHYDDVKMIMIDPKVVELSVYNGIPHLLIPVVTDPKKASAALHWGVTEMEDRYRKFAEFNVRDLKGYNKKLETMREAGEENVPKKLPQIVIIVDELADLMMVSPGEVEESICRLAQLARAAGIHLIIATQRPSVDVITGLIKANMPSRVAFAVSSGVDSRTILDMNGAEKLLGKGDMLFYPQNYSKPARIQGAFVSDKEVQDVVDFLKNQQLGNIYDEEATEKISNYTASSAGSSSQGGGSSEGDGRDELFAEAGRAIIDKDKASIGMLQRMFKIGFNRAARIMDQLCDYGVVGEEEGTKPRKIMMSMEQFEQLLEEI